MGMQFSDLVENIVGKEEIARDEQFLHLPQCFQKLSIVDALKLVSMEQRVKCQIFKLGIYYIKHLTIELFCVPINQ